MVRESPPAAAAAGSAADDAPGAASVREGARILREGGLVGFPTETIYGLGANAFDETAVARIYRLKGRPSDNPLIVHVSDERMLREVVAGVPVAARELMRRFWPGPLTIIFDKGSRIPGGVTRLPTVAVRMPDHPVALALIARAGVPVAAPSANKSGSPSPTTAAHVREDFPGLFIIDGGPAHHGLESTVVAVDGVPRVLRLGAIPLERLREAVPGIRLANRPPKGAAPESPGMKYRHYAPKQPLIVFGPRKISQMRRYAKNTPGAVVLCKERFVKEFGATPAISLGSTDADVARNLFGALRSKQGEVLLILGVPRRGIGRSVMDRLERAATRLL